MNAIFPVPSNDDLQPVTQTAGTGTVALLDRLAGQTAGMRRTNAALADSNRIVGKALAAAQAGVWHCDLRNEHLDWTSGVYEMFDLAPGARLRREDIIACYAGQSRTALETLRSQAIETGAGFALDAEIVTLKGRSRWIRLTAGVERENGVSRRLYGMKQDITETKVLMEQARRLAEVDALTGLSNRAVFERRLAQARSGATAGGSSATLLLIDLDGFKQVNDCFGHAIGDVCLKEAATRLKTACAGAELVARIGGDEFAALLGVHLGREEVEEIAAEIVAALRFAIEREGQRVSLGASVGVAFASDEAPWRQFAQADAALYRAKAAGRGSFRIA